MGSSPSGRPSREAVADAGLTFVGPTRRGDRGARRQARRAAARAERRRRHRPGDPRRRAGRPPGRRGGHRRRGRGDRLPAARQGGRRWRGPRDAPRRASRGPARRARDRVGRGGQRRSATARSTSSARSARRATSRSSCSATRRARSWPSASATARIQRRHQKLVEEAPAPGLSQAARRALHERAVRIASAAGLTNAATAEFLLEPDGAVWFLEVNTRLQVEHGVTELVTGLDLVREQLWLAAGRPLSEAALAAAARAGEPTRHAIEVRLTAEDPGRGFAPTPGTIRHWAMPAGPGSGWTRRARRARGCRPSTTTSWPRSWWSPTTAPPPSSASGAPSTRPRSPGSRRRSRSTGSWRATPPSGTRTCRSTGSRSTGTARPGAGTRWRSRSGVAARAFDAAGAAAAPPDPPAGQPTRGGWRASARAAGIDRWPR